MPSSNTPSDLKTVIIRALDAACTNASDENSNGRLSRRSFANIKELPRLLFQCATLATPRCDPVGKRQHRWEQAPCFLFSQSQFAQFQRRIVESAWPSPDDAWYFRNITYSPNCEDHS